MIVKNGFVYLEDKIFAPQTLFVENGVLVASEEQVSDKEVVDAQGLRIIPGLIDVHSHGAVGHDFSDNDLEGLAEILRYEYAHGVTTYCPTSMTLPKEKLLELYANTGRAAYVLQEENMDPAADKMARIAGFHMEGPFLAPTKNGAHKEEYILAPDIRLFRDCNAACGGRIRLVTIAPERGGAMELIGEIKEDAVISLGHTGADYDTAAKALAAGAKHVTHLFNAMQPFSHRAPGLIGAAADCEDCMAELIVDGVHVHESAVRAAFRMFPGRVVLISDSMRAAGMPDGRYELGGQQVYVRGDRAELADGTIAGSVTNLFDCMRKAVDFGIPVEEAVAAATINPAKSIGIYNEVGSLTVGKRADMLLVDDDLRLIRVL